MSRKTTVGDPVAIDGGRLDAECLDQPRRVREAGEAVADARHDHAKAKAGLDLVEAEIRLKVLTTPSEWDGAALPEKLTVDSINALIVTHDKYKAAVKALGEAKYALDMEEANLTALHHRKSMLSDCVQLHLTNYHSDPRVEAAPAVRERVKEKARAVADTPAVFDPARKKKKKKRPAA